ncbi:MAG: NUDIX hydrolase [Deltaproteobacteria bacterium]|nr:NUDIX hydrolase [Deltaproteobacteria bacterium]
MTTQGERGPRLRRVPEGDDRERLVCPDCEYIAYENPKNVVGSVPVHEGKVLLCRRAIEPRRGHWTLPAGFMELGETPAEGAAREAMEEAGADLELGALIGIYSVVHIGQVHIFYRSTLRSPELSVGTESLELGFFTFDEALALDLAFPTVRHAIEDHLALPEAGFAPIERRLGPPARRR